MDNREFYIKLVKTDSNVTQELLLSFDREEVIHPWSIAITILVRDKVEETGHMFADSLEDGLVRLKRYAGRLLGEGYTIAEKRSRLAPAAVEPRPAHPPGRQ